VVPRIPSARIDEMKFDDYKVVLYRNQPHGWVAEIPTPEEALAELAQVFRIIEREHRGGERNIVHPVLFSLTNRPPSR
jgi:hypothetical protein